MRRCVGFLLLLLLTSCVYLTFDDTKAAPLVMVSRTPTPAFEEVRSFVQFGDLVYVAAGSGGILVYRIVGDQMQPAPNLSISNIYADALVPTFIRTVEVVEGVGSTNLIFSFDTVEGGGVGAAEITPMYTKPLGALTSLPSMRIRRTDTRADNDGGFTIIVANEYAGIMTLKLSIVSNNFFDQQNLASIAGYVARQGLGGGPLPFERLQPPRLNNEVSVSNFDGLVQLFRTDPAQALSVASNLPFLTENQRNQIQALATQTGISSNAALLNQAAGLLDSPIGSQALDIARQFLGPAAASPAPPPVPVTPPAPPQPPSDYEEGGYLEGGYLEEADDIMFTNEVGATAEIIPPVSNMLPVTEQDKDFLLSNMLALTNYNVDTNTLNTPDFNPFIYTRPIPDARNAIDTTAAAFGFQDTSDDQGILKDRLRSLTTTEQDAVFNALFTQSDLLPRLIPLLETAGFNPRQLYEIWQDGRITEIIDKLGTGILADLINLLPQTQIESKITIVATNTILPSVRNMSSDGRSLYLALGKEGFAVVDRATGEIRGQIVKEMFSEVEAVTPFDAYGRRYIATADRLNGLSIYERLGNDAPGKSVSHLNLVGEGVSLYAQSNILWVADGSNGVLAINFMKDQSLRVEGEFFDKTGIARYIGTARSREALVSYGADGFVRLRFTNIGPGESTSSTNAGSTTLAEKTLEWNNTSPFFRFLRRLFL
ncbi:MAG: hypothetical protein ACRCY4_02235 [Brevinema sp.]